MISIRIAVCLLEIHIPEATSLKQKRQVIESLLKRLRNRFNLSAAEVGHRDLWQRSELGLAAVCRDSASADRMMERVLSFIERDSRVSIISLERELY